MRKTWSKPELIVLVKGTADERVLQGCKGVGAYMEGPGFPHDSGLTDPCLANGLYCGVCRQVAA